MPHDEKYFQDPIHGFIEVSDCALEIVNCPYFQRLRRIKQLGFTDLVFHGAEHTRFGHSLGVYHLAKKLSDRLLEKHNGEIRKEFCLAALLHDIGHYPLSHTFEAVVMNKKENGDDYKHEKYTTAIIENIMAENYFKNSGLSGERVVQLINGEFTDVPELLYLNGLISSDLDLDRLDYLQRDAFYCGVPYGKIDADRIILSLDPESETGFTDKGMHSVEMFMLARFYMYIQVYMHHTRRAFDVMLNNVFSEDSINDLNYPEPEKVDVSRIVNFDDEWLRSQVKDISKNGKAIAKNLATNILNRVPVKCVFEISTYVDGKSDSADPLYSYVADMMDERTDIAKKAGIKEEAIFIDEPGLEIFSDEYNPHSPSSSLAHQIAKRSMQIYRVYTLDEYRTTVAKVIAGKYPELANFVWKPK